VCRFWYGPDSHAEPGLSPVADSLTVAVRFGTPTMREAAGKYLHRYRFRLTDLFELQLACIAILIDDYGFAREEFAGQQPQ